MNKIKHICLFTNEYPTNTDPVYSFVEQLCIEFSRNNIDVTIISPQSITSALLHHTEIHPRFRMIKIENKGTLQIYQPYCLSFPFRFKKFNDWFFYMAAKKTLQKIQTDFDVVYCHFWRPGYIAYKIFKNSKPLFVATGESCISNMFNFEYDLAGFKQALNGVIAVSTKNKNESINLGLADSSIIKVIPNAINNQVFYQRNKLEARKKIKIPHDVFVIAFVGWFNERKGSLRVSQAIKSIDDKIYSIFIGAGDSEPTCENILFKGRLPHSEIPTYLSAADVFVLPTLNEGCCNAVIEAMACGLPVISSRLPFNFDVLDSSNSIMVDPNSIEAIANAINVLKQNKELREELSRGSLEKAKGLTLNQRAINIINFINNNLQ